MTTPVPLVSTTASKWILKVKIASAYVAVRGITDFQPALATTTQDDSDYDSGLWGSDAKTQLKWSLVAKLSRKTADGYVEDPGQAALRAASDQVGTAGTVDVQWYDRNGGTEAYQGMAMVQWSEDGGNTTALSMASVTLNGQGVRNVITNPVGP